MQSGIDLPEHPSSQHTQRKTCGKNKQQYINNKKIIKKKIREAFSVLLKYFAFFLYVVLVS